MDPLDDVPAGYRIAPSAPRLESSELGLTHALTHHPLPGIDPRRLQQLSAAGLESLEDVAHAGPERLAELTGFDLKTCRALVIVATDALVPHHPDAWASTGTTSVLDTVMLCEPEHRELHRGATLTLRDGRRLDAGGWVV